MHDEYTGVILMDTRHACRIQYVSQDRSENIISLRNFPGRDVKHEAGKAFGMSGETY